MTRRTPRVLAALVLLALAGCTTGDPGAGPSPTVSATASPTPSPTPSPIPSLSASPTPVPTLTPATLEYAVEEVGRFDGPIWVGPAPGDRTHLYLALKAGRVLQLDALGRQQSVVLDLSGRVSRGNEQGLLSLAFDPSYASNHRMYVDYTDRAGDTQVVAYTVTNGVAGSPQVLLTLDQPYANHNGGLVLFDSTGMLLVGTGDGGAAGDPEDRAQNLRSDLGKILRIDPRTGAPAAGNPYSRNPKVWALGLRNPWRFSFDAAGYLYVGDVGQNKVEELDVVAPSIQTGANYGWPVFEGDERFKAGRQFTPGGPVIVPALTYEHATGGCSITAGEVYHGSALPELDGTFLYADYCAGRIYGVTRTASGLSPILDLRTKVQGLQAFGHDLAGEVLVLSPDRVLRLVRGTG